MSDKPCPACKGTGRAIDRVSTGAELKQLREKANFKLTAVAKDMGISHPSLSLKEAGLRPWTEQEIAAYRKAIGL